MLITPEYLEQQKALHAKGNYGIVGGKLAPMVLSLWQGLGGPLVLDYGCGQGKLANALPQVQFDLYDPAIPRHSAHPTKSYKLITCTDVMEHIEPECLVDVITDLHALLEPGGCLFLEIAEGPAGKTLPDGRNAHLIQQSMGWWIEAFETTADLRAQRAERQNAQSFVAVFWRAPAEAQQVAA